MACALRAPRATAGAASCSLRGSGPAFSAGRPSPRATSPSTPRAAGAPRASCRRPMTAITRASTASRPPGPCVSAEVSGDGLARCGRRSRRDQGGHRPARAGVGGPGREIGEVHDRSADEGEVGGASRDDLRRREGAAARETERVAPAIEITGPGADGDGAEAERTERPGGRGVREVQREEDLGLEAHGRDVVLVTLPPLAGRASRINCFRATCRVSAGTT